MCGLLLRFFIFLLGHDEQARASGYEDARKLVDEVKLTSGHKEFKSKITGNSYGDISVEDKSHVRVGDTYDFVTNDEWPRPRMRRGLIARPDEMEEQYFGDTYFEQPTWRAQRRGH